MEYLKSTPTKEEDDANPSKSPYSGHSMVPSLQSSEDPIQQNSQANWQFRVPSSFSMYKASTWSRTLMLGEHQNEPLYAVTLHTGISGQADVVLHNGPSEQAPPLATVNHKAFKRFAIVTLPPVDSDRSDGRVEERLEHQVSFGSTRTDSFSIEVGEDGHREAFEWRRSRGADVSALGGMSRGYKLVRLSGDELPAALNSGVVTSDGKEVVAMWVEAKMSITKRLKFQFLGSGASGVLGERWAIMAVITALRAWDREQKAKGGG